MDNLWVIPLTAPIFLSGLLLCAYMFAENWLEIRYEEYASQVATKYYRTYLLDKTASARES